MISQEEVGQTLLLDEMPLPRWWILFTAAATPSWKERFRCSWWGVAAVVFAVVASGESRQQPSS